MDRVVFLNGVSCNNSVLQRPMKGDPTHTNYCNNKIINNKIEL